MSTILSPGHERTRLIKSAAYASLIVAVTLVLAKAWGWQATSSIAMLASLADSILDVAASAITFWAVRFSLSPADKEHRFGHGKSEGLAALVQAGIIGASAIYVCVEAIKRFINPEQLAHPEAGLTIVLAATAATVLLVFYQHHVGKKTGSLAITADAMHYKADVIVNLSVAVAILVTGWTGWWLVDPLVGIGVGAFILVGAVNIGRHALLILLDHEIPPEDRSRIEQIALGHAEVLGFHDMKTRHGGTHYIVQFHLELDPDISLLKTHQILDEVEDEIRDQYPGCELIVHADPQGLPERRDSFD